MEDTQIMILAAGRSSRLKMKIPKPLVKIHDKPMILHTTDIIKKTGFQNKIILIINERTQQIKELLDDRAVYSYQKTPNGTGGAVIDAKNQIDLSIPLTIVLYSDMPFLYPKTLINMRKEMNRNKSTIVMGTIDAKEWTEQNEMFKHFGRIIRDEKNNISNIREYKDANEEERAITEVNPSRFCFDTKWLYENIGKLNTDNVQGEYYLTDLIKLAYDQNKLISSIPITVEESMGVNTQEDLKKMTELFDQKYTSNT